MENPEEILHSLEEFSKMKPKDIPRELEEYLCFVAKTGNPVYQWPTIKSLFREKLLNVITEFYESCPSVEIPPCPNVEMFNYDLMKNFILEKLDTFASAPFTVQRICELLTTPRKEYNRIDKYMRALEKNILVVSTTEPGRRSTENGEGIMNGIESEHLPESSNSSHDINVEEMDESPSWPRTAQVAPVLFENSENENQSAAQIQQISATEDSFENNSESKLEMPSSSTVSSSQPQVQSQHETVITCRSIEETQQPYVSIEPVPLNVCTTSHPDPSTENEADASVTITAVPAGVQQRRTSVERVGSTENTHVEADDIKATTVTEVVVEKLAEKEEEPKEILPSDLPSSETTEEPAIETKLVIISEEPALVVQEESGIENISPENSSSSPETLQIDIVPEQDKNQLEKTEKVTDQVIEHPEIEEKENTPEESVKWSEEEVKKSPIQQECVEADTSSPEVKEEVESSTQSSACEGETSEVDKPEESSPCQELEVGCSVPDCSEKSFDSIQEQDQEQEDKEAEPISELPVSESDCKIDSEETPMEVDILSETGLEKKEESPCEEPSSTFDASAL